MGDLAGLLAFDIGNSGGRVLWGGFDGQSLNLKEIYHFPNGPVRIGERWYWDVFRLYEELGRGLRAASEGR